jgi:hypothetical protein
MLWRGDELIKSKADLFTNRPKYDLPKIEGMKDIVTNDSIKKPFYKQKDLSPKSNLKTKTKDSIFKAKKKEKLEAVKPLKKTEKMKMNND